MTSTNIGDVCDFLAKLAPLELAEDWDNVGLLVGSRKSKLVIAMTCLTATDDVIQTAIESQVSLLIPHHPLPFRPLHRITDEMETGRLLLNLIKADIGLYCAHTAWDSAEFGINFQLATKLGLESIEPLVPSETNSNVGVGRVGELRSPTHLTDFSGAIESALPESRLRTVISHRRKIVRVGIGCGSAGSMVGLAARSNCDTFLTGEATYHQCLEAKSLGINLILTGHYASERFAMRDLGERIGNHFPECQVLDCTTERDPVERLERDQSRDLDSKRRQRCRRLETTNLRTRDKFEPHHYGDARKRPESLDQNASLDRRA